MRLEQKNKPQRIQRNVFRSLCFPCSLRLKIAALFLALLFAQPAAAWSRKEHVLVTRAAAKLIVDDPTAPPALKDLLREGIGNPEKFLNLGSFVVDFGDAERLDPGLDLYSFRPDQLVSAGSRVETFNLTEERMHYLDMELFHRDSSRREFAADGSNKIRKEDLPRNPNDMRYKTAGFILFRAEQSYKSLVESLRKNNSNEQVFLWLGYLSHYVSDSYQPFHSTVDYRGFDCPCNSSRTAKIDFHPFMEGRLFQDKRPEGVRLRERFWDYFQEALSKRAGQTGNSSKLDVYIVVRDALFSGYDYLPMMCKAGAASLAGGEFNPDAWFNYSESVGGRQLSLLQLKSERVAEAALIMRSLILQAWNEAQVQPQRPQRSRRKNP